MIISELNKELEQKTKDMGRVEQVAFEEGQKGTEAHLKSQILMVCRSFCLQTWVEALNATGVDPSSELRNPEKLFYPPAIRAHTLVQPPSNTTTTAQPSSTKNPPPKSNTTTPTSSTVTAKTSSIKENPTSAETTPSSQPTTEGQASGSIEKKKGPEAFETQ